MKYLILLLLLTGCTTVPVAQKFPEAPQQLLETCDRLQLLENPTTLSILTKTVAENYKRYHLCANKHEGLVEWYRQQKRVFEEIAK